MGALKYYDTTSGTWKHVMQGPKGDKGDTGPQGPAGSGTGDVVGPASATANNVALFDGTTGKLIKDSGLTLTGTNTGDETLATIKTKLGITTLSGTNTGDQDLSTYATITGMQTLTNKNVVPLVNSVYTTATFGPTTYFYAMEEIIALDTNLTVNAPNNTGGPANGANGQKYLLRIKDNGTARTITWNAIYRAIGVTLPTTTVAGKTMYIGMIYNAQDSKWDVIAVATEA